MQEPDGAPLLQDPPLAERVLSDSAAEPSQGRTMRSLMAARVGDTPLRPPLFVDGDDDLVTVCHALHARGTGEALVRDGDRLGIFTTTDLRNALLRPEPPSVLRVREVTSFRTISIADDDELAEALILMVRHRIHRLLVRRGDAVIGLLGQHELMAFLANHSHLIVLQIADAADLAALRAAAAQIDELIRGLRRDGVRVDVIARLVGELNRHLFQRLWELLAPEELRINSCLVVMGSEGRGEQIIKTDQDNALIVRDDFTFPELGAVTQAFTAALIDFGYPPCPGGVMLSRPLWCKPLGEFSGTVRDWILEPDREGPMNLAIFLDAVAVTGDPRLLSVVRDEIDRLVAGNGPWLSRFARAVEQFGEDRSWWERIPGLRGRGAATIDIKKLGLFPVVHGVRALALEHRLAEVGTVPRIRALAANGRLDAAIARDLTDALHVMIGLKLDNNLRQIGAGEVADNRIRLSDLGTLDREALRESIAIVRSFKSWLSRHFRFDLL